MNKSEINEIKNLFRIKDCENTYCRPSANYQYAATARACLHEVINRVSEYTWIIL